MDSKFDPPSNRRSKEYFLIAGVLLLALTSPIFSTFLNTRSSKLSNPSSSAQAHFKDLVERCSHLNDLPSNDFVLREKSDRVSSNAKVQLLRNGTIWTGENLGMELLYGYDILLKDGLIKEIGLNLEIDGLDLQMEGEGEVEITELHGSFVTPGVFDSHSHLGVDSSPELNGNDDTNSLKAPIQPWLRSLDGINTHDYAYKRSISGGVTSALILPGSANSMGGQAFVIKLREMSTPDEMVLEMPNQIPGFRSHSNLSTPLRWRHLKNACGENIARVYHETRMDEQWGFRQALEKARLIKKSQDGFCETVGELKKNLGKKASIEAQFPEELQWEILVDVLRGKVKVNTHCYTQTDLASYVRLTNEFKFPLAAFHHAHEAFKSIDLLKSTYGGAPAVAIFAQNALYKAEAYHGSEYAGKILTEANMTVIYKSDHPVLDSRYLLFEAQQGHHFGVAENHALRSLTTNPAIVQGMDHRLGYIRIGFDADVVIWNSHPLKLGATPIQTFIDGIPQIPNSHASSPLSTTPLSNSIASVPQKPYTLQDDDFTLYPLQKTIVDAVKFINVAAAILKGSDGKLKNFIESEGLREILVKNGKIICVAQACSSVPEGTEEVDLKGGHLLPPFSTYGTLIGLTEIIAEKSTGDASVPSVPLSLIEDDGSKNLVRAVDGLSFGGKHLEIARSNGVGYSIGKIMTNSFYGGLSASFRVNAKSVLESTAILKEISAVHINWGHISGSGKPSISTQIAKLRMLLSNSTDESFIQVANGQLPLVIEVSKADHIASLILLKRNLEQINGNSMKWIFSGCQEAYLVASGLAEAEIGVILNPPRAFPGSWDTRRASPGPPWVEKTAPSILFSAGVKLAIGVPEEWQTRQLCWEASWLSKNSGGIISSLEALKMISSNLEEMFDFSSNIGSDEFVAWERDPFEFGSRVVAFSTADSRIELFR